MKNISVNKNVSVKIFILNVSLYKGVPFLILKVIFMSARRIALRRIQKLFRLAIKRIHTNPRLARRYVEIARRIAMRVRLHLPREYRHMVCRHCKSFILPGVNCRVRIQPKREAHIVITCLMCGGHMRIPLRRRRKDDKPKN